MGQGAQSHALNIVSRAKGWDPTAIMGDNFDKDPSTDPMTHKTTGNLPEGTPDSFPEDHGDVGPGTAWEHPNNNDGNQPERHTVNANPVPGMPGAGG